MFVCAVIIAATVSCSSQDAAKNPSVEKTTVGAQPESGQLPTVGLIFKDSLASDGYILFSPIAYAETYLIDTDRQLVHSWQSAYLLENGHLL